MCAYNKLCHPGPGGQACTLSTQETVIPGLGVQDQPCRTVDTVSDKQASMQKLKILLREFNKKGFCLLVGFILFYF